MSEHRSDLFFKRKWITPVEHEGQPIWESNKAKLHEASRAIVEQSMWSLVNLFSTSLRISIYSWRNEIIWFNKTNWLSFSAKKSLKSIYGEKNTKIELNQHFRNCKRNIKSKKIKLSDMTVWNLTSNFPVCKKSF